MIWLIVGALIGVSVRLAGPRGGFLAMLGAAVAGALLAGIAAEVLVGDGASLRMTISSGGAFATVRFGLVPVLAALAGAMTAVGLASRHFMREHDAAARTP